MTEVGVSRVAERAVVSRVATAEVSHAAESARTWAATNQGYPRTSGSRIEARWILAGSEEAETEEAETEEAET